MPTLTLPANLQFNDLHQADGIQQIDRLFLQYCQQHQPEVHQFILAYRAKALSLTQVDISKKLIAVAQIIESFLASFFVIEEAVEDCRCQTLQYDPIFQFKKDIILKQARRLLKKPLAQHDYDTLLAKFDSELAFAEATLQAQNTDQSHFAILLNCCVYILNEKPAHCADWVSFQLPQKIDFELLVNLDNISHSQRDGFALTDPRMSSKQVQKEVHYCVYCHEKEDDFCSKGFPNNKRQPELGFKKNPLDVMLAGCPLEEKISEMNWLKHQGHSIAALAMVMRDNPMCPATGHRICNDCMKSCIYQKQDPVNIPEIETRVLTDVLNLPWGVEIYALLTRWNPLRQQQYALQPYNHYKVMVAGLGPAGFTMAHHLLMEGCHVTAFDGLKIEPLPEETLQQPIHNYQSICESLDERQMMGFGGVAEYGITNRWDKNFLKLIYITLARHQHFTVLGNVRFGGTVTVEDAQRLGYDHLCIAVGAGLPKALPIPGSLAPGMRQANDFLMNLQLSSAMKADAVANLQIRMPIIVIGGGLTGVDTATEAQAYYLSQIEKLQQRYNKLCANQGAESVRAALSTLECTILDEQLAHAEQLVQERALAKAEKRPADTLTLLQHWGGTKIVYRRRIQESPAYISNHEELAKALEQGIEYCENAWPVATELDEYGQVSGLTIKTRHHDEDGEWQLGDESTIPAKTILVATGARLNIAYSFEHPDTFAKDNGHYLPHEWDGNKLQAVNVAEHCKIANFGPFTSYHQNNFLVSFIGDSHPAFHGNVVKAIASASKSYAKIMTAMQAQQPNNHKQDFAQTIHHCFSATLRHNDKLSNHMHRLVIHCPMAAQKAKPGQFFRLQNFTTDISNSIEPLALAVARIDGEELHFIVNDIGVSSQHCQQLQPGDTVALMGPSGVRSKLNDNEHILIVGNALATIQAQALSQLPAKNTKIDCISNETSMDIPDSVKLIATNNVLECYQQHDVSNYDRIVLIGDKAFLQSCKLYYDTQSERFKPSVKLFAAAYAPMQCMLKGVCAQCLVWQKDSETGMRKKAVFACSWQHQPLELLDIDNLFERLSQNSLQEKIANMLHTHPVN